MVVAGLKMGAPHTLSALAGRSLVSRNRRGGPSLRVVRDVQLRGRRRASRLGYHRVHAPARESSWHRCAASPRHRRAGVWSGCLVGREHARAAAGRRCGPLGSHDSATIPRYRRGCRVLRQDVRGTDPSSATFMDRGHRPSETPGPSGGEQQLSAEATGERSPREPAIVGRGSRLPPSDRSPLVRPGAASAPGVPSPR